MSQPFANPDNEDCKVCHDEGYIPGTYRLCPCVGGEQAFPPLNPNKGSGTPAPAISFPVSEEEHMATLPPALHYTWHDFEPEPDGTGDGSGDPDKHILTIAHDGEEVCVIVHRVGSDYPIDGAVAAQKRLIAQHIVDALNANPIDWDRISDQVFKDIRSNRG